MAKPPVFDRYTHERQKDLLKAEDQRLQDKEERKGFYLVVIGLGCAALLLYIFGSWLLELFH